MSRATKKLLFYIDRPFTVQIAQGQYLRARKSDHQQLYPQLVLEKGIAWLAA
jgi:hypothetical protein